MAGSTPFTGYKGGEYYMGPGTPVWADPWGEYNETQILGLREIDEVVQVITSKTAMELIDSAIDQGLV
jgi:hypothetical protein